jgi:hypothetical protein
MLANTQVSSQQTHRIKKNRQDSKEEGHGSTSGKWKEEINNKLSQPRTHKTITKRKDLPA